ncbi:MAG: DnaJ C-terminal domain-containing protein [Candidatus Limnocylindrales bacterium]
MEYKDYYAALGVPRTASAAEIKKQFRKLARQHHPDVNKGDAAAERRFKEVSEANQVLSDPEKRKLYDRMGADWEAYQRASAGGGAAQGDPFEGFRQYAGGAGGPGGTAGPGGIRFEYHGDPEDLAGFSDFFRTFFGGGAAPPGRAASRGAAGTRTRVRTASSLEDLMGGLGGRQVDLDGLGGPSYGSPGAGGRSALRADAQAEATISLEEAFHGTQRRVEIDGRRLDVRIPRGVDTGRRIRLTGKAGSGPDAGDLYVRVTVAPHPDFTREGTNLRRDVPVTLAEAMLGAEVAVRSLKGRVLLRIPAGTQNGRTFRLKSQGMPRFAAADGEAPAGDLLARVNVVLPDGLSDEAQERFKAFTELVDQPDPRA